MTDNISVVVLPSSESNEMLVKLVLSSATRSPQSVHSTPLQDCANQFKCVVVTRSSLRSPSVGGRQTARGEQLSRRAAEQVVKIADEPVDVSSARSFVDDVLVIVVAQTAAQLLVIHLGFIFSDAPSASYLVRVGQPKLPTVPGP